MAQSSPDPSHPDALILPWGLKQQTNQFHVANDVTGAALRLYLLSLLIEAGNHLHFIHS